MNELNINLNGLNIAYQDSGNESTPIIFLHGFPFDKVPGIRNWKRLDQITG